MELPDLKKLGAIIDLCRKKGVSCISLGDMKIEIREQAPASNYKRRMESSEQEDILNDPENPYSNFPEGELTPEQLMYYSAGGSPENDPALKDQQ